MKPVHFHYGNPVPVKIKGLIGNGKVFYRMLKAYASVLFVRKYIVLGFSVGINLNSIRNNTLTVR